MIGVFESQTQGMTLAQASANAATIQAAMTNAILAQGPSNVSKHCADPATISVVDVPLSNFSANGRTLFRAIAAARSRLLEENNVYHMEIQLGNP
ncbi:hypothetical protein [Massilia brevitalea]|uniref:hypothetical protein n=1 Tax=Massilia brevitalea TaxID=442526 RepID=UPI00273A3222|nr:hypothetical protein [Massilia brevitalea]